MRTRIIHRASVVCLVVGMLACGDENESLSPTAPSPAGHPAAGAAAAGDGAIAEPATAAGIGWVPEGDLVEDQPVIRVNGQLPPGLTPAMLEADLRAELAAEDAWQQMVGQVRSLTRPDAPGEHEITSITSSGAGDPVVYSMTANLSPPTPRPTHTGLIWIDRYDGRDRTRVRRGDIQAGASSVAFTENIHLGRDANGNASSATHKIRPGWYVFWTMARNCNTEGSERRCRRGPISVMTHEVEEPPPAAGPPGPPSIASTEITSWDCPDFPAGDPCVANVTIHLRDLVAETAQVEIFLVDLGGTPTRENVPEGATRTMSLHLEPGMHRSRLRQRRVGGEWSEWLEQTPRRLTILPDDSVTDGDPPGAPRNVTATKLSDWRWRVSWDAPSDNGGWPISSYRMGIHGRSPNGRQSRSCGGESWPYQNVPAPEDLAGADGRRYSQVLVSIVPEDGDWKVGVTAVNVRGEGDCGSFDPFP